MNGVRLGKTEMTVCKNGFGALPIQRKSFDEAVSIIKKAYENGINFYDTARFYTDSEEKLGAAFCGIRDKVYIASKTMAKNGKEFYADLATTLKNLKTDYLDLYQFHDPSFCPKPGDGSGLYEAMQDVHKKGYVKHIGITNHALAIAIEAIESGLYETLQFPFSYIADKREVELAEKCRKADMGFIAMKGLAGGLISSSKAAFYYISQFENVLPVWGIQHEWELDEFIEFEKNPPKGDDEIIAIIEKDRKELAGEFCRGCGYCMPCPVGIEINNCARMSLLLRRSPAQLQLTEQVKAKMKKIEDCLNCGQCSSRCPYELDTPQLLKKNYEDYKTFL